MRYGMILMGLLSFQFGCAKVAIVAHRGASYDAPENTLAAFGLAWEQGADAVETDLYLSKDGKIIVIHDPTTKRTAGLDTKVVEQTLEELRTLDAGAWKGGEWSGERLPTLEEVLDSVPRGKRVLLEVKCGPEIVPVLRETIPSSPLKKGQVIVISFHEDVIAAVKREMPETQAYWLFEFKKDKKSGEWNSTHEELIARAKRIHADGVDLAANEKVDGRLAGLLHEAGLELHVWTVNEPVLARRMIGVGTRSITTDRPGWLREQLQSTKPPAS